MSKHGREHYLRLSLEEAERAIAASDPVTHRRCVELSQHYWRMASRADGETGDDDMKTNLTGGECAGENGD